MRWHEETKRPKCRQDVEVGVLQQKGLKSTELVEIECFFDLTTTFFFLLSIKTKAIHHFLNIKVISKCCSVF